MHSARVPLELNDYSPGMNSYLSNDKMPERNNGRNYWRLAQDARIPRLGTYQTRKGFDRYSDTIGLNADQQITSTTGAADQNFSETAYLAQKWTCGTSGNLAAYGLNLKSTASGTGTILIEHWTDNGGSPGDLISRTSVASSTLTSSYAYYTAYFPDAPPVVSGTVYWIVAHIQVTGSNSYQWSSTTSASTAKTSPDGSATWSAASFALNFRQYYTANTASTGLHRAYKSDGTKTTLLTTGGSLYQVNDTTGALLSITSGLNSATSRARFTTVNDTVYYVNGYDGLRKWDFSTESQVNTTNYTLICNHKGLLFLAGGADPNAIVYSNFGLYETFTSTDLIYADAPKNGDPVTALVPLNGSLYIYTRANKFILSGADNASFSVDEAPDQKGTYTQETVCTDNNYMYFLSDDGVYRSNGSEAQLLSGPIYSDIVNLANKDKCVLAINKGRLYLWYPSAGAGYNDSCYVWNLNIGKDCVESHDTNAYVSAAITASGTGDTDQLIVASSRNGTLMYQELDSNDYTNLGGDINFELDTHYLTYSTPSQLHQIRRLRPRFEAVSTNHVVTCQYATDLRDNPQDVAYIDVQANGYLWGDPGTIWGSFYWGASSEVDASFGIPGAYKRIQIRYKHSATRQPVTFLGHSQTVEIRRPR